MRNDFESNYLAHHGIKGQSWGDRNGPPYPLDRKAHSAKEKKAGWMKSLKDKAEAKKKKKKQQAALDKARKTKAANEKQKKLEEKYKEEKTKILKSGKASEVAKYKGQMTNQELSEAVNRIRMEKELDKMSAAENKSNFDIINGYMDKAKTMTNWAKTGIEAYDTFAKIYNWKHPDNKLRYIGKDNKEDKKKKDEDDD